MLILVENLSQWYALPVKMQYDADSVYNSRSGKCYKNRNNNLAPLHPDLVKLLNKKE